MFKIAIRNISVMTVVLFASYLYGQSKSEWQKFVAPDGSFSVLFPQKPKTTTKTEKSSKGKSVIYVASSFNRMFDFGVEQITADYDMEHDDRVDVIRDNLVTQFGANLVSQSETQLGDNKGIDMVFINSERNFKAKILVSGRRSYVVAISAPDSVQGDGEQIDKFLKSFEILKSGQ